mmetsp:Transcript_86512/g.253230  ORF Transcript_86512/g.253230 Transcript_86512/m.253230 type:complete len:242 (-) Transcript_86512:1212-1937(-)
MLLLISSRRRRVAMTSPKSRCLTVGLAPSPGGLRPPSRGGGRVPPPAPARVRPPPTGLLLKSCTPSSAWVAAASSTSAQATSTCSSGTGWAGAKYQPGAPSPRERGRLAERLRRGRGAAARLTRQTLGALAARCWAEGAAGSATEAPAAPPTASKDPTAEPMGVAPVLQSITPRRPTLSFTGSASAAARRLQNSMSVVDAKDPAADSTADSTLASDGQAKAGKGEASSTAAASWKGEASTA